MSSKPNNPEPFGYFRAMPFGWEDCAATDEGSRALYDEGAINTQAARIAELEAELATERMRLSACGVIALANTPESAAKARDMHPDYMSGSAQDVMAAVDREMALRAEVERLRKPLTPEAVWQLWAEVCKPAPPPVELVEAFARAIEAAKEGK